MDADGRLNPDSWTPDQRLAVLAVLFGVGAMLTTGAARQMFGAAGLAAALYSAFNDDDPVPLLTTPATPTGAATRAAIRKKVGAENLRRKVKKSVESGAVEPDGELQPGGPELELEPSVVGSPGFTLR